MIIPDGTYNVENLYAALCWHEDMKIVNHFGEYVWLKPLIVEGQRIGITDCCFVASPCERHLTFKEAGQ